MANAMVWRAIIRPGQSKKFSIIAVATIFNTRVGSKNPHTYCACGYAYDYTELPYFCFILPAVAPFFLWLGELPVVKRLLPWQATTVRVVLVIVPCAISLALVFSAMIETATNNLNNYY